MAALTIPPRSCLHLVADYNTTWTSTEQFSYISEALIQPTIFSVGILTNILSIIILVGVKMNKVFRLCLISLAISDLFSTVFGLIQILIEVIFYCGRVPEGHLLTPVVVNNALYMAFLVSMSISSSLVVFIAFIRNMMYLKPIKSRMFFTSRTTGRVCGGIFIVTFLLYVPNSLQEIWLLCYNETGNEPAFCWRVQGQIPNLKKLANGYLFFTVTLYGPAMLLAYVANLICIRITLRKSAEAIGHVTGRLDKRRSTINRITKILTLILICDVICTLPSIVQGIGLLFAPEDGVFEKKIVFFEILDPVAEILLALRPTYNFWLYVFQRSEFRIGLCQLARKMCRGRQCRHKSTHPDPPSDDLDTNSSRSMMAIKTITD